MDFSVTTKLTTLFQNLRNGFRTYTQLFRPVSAKKDGCNLYRHWSDCPLISGGLNTQDPGQVFFTHAPLTGWYPAPGFHPWCGMVGL